jgi:hypothetical protein
MANAEHLAILQQGTAIWNDWRIRNPGPFPDLSRASLSRADLRQANLRGRRGIFSKNLVSRGFHGRSREHRISPPGCGSEGASPYPHRLCSTLTNPAKSNSDSLPAERAKNDFLGLTDDGGQVFGAFKTFRVKLIDILRSGRAGGEPTADGDNLQATDRCVVARCTR